MVALREVARRRLGQLTHRIHALPVVVLMPHSRCNCRCVMCDIWKANSERRELTADDLAPHLEDFERLGVRQVVLSGGEALMHSNLWRLCDDLRARNIEITLLSTGLLLEKHADDVVRSFTEVIVSLDGSPEVHDDIRKVPRAFERLAEGVRALRARDPEFRVTARCVVQRLNYFDLEGVVQTAVDLGLHQISFLAADVSTPAFNRALLWKQERVSEIALSRPEADELERIIEAIIERRASDFDRGFMAESPDKLRRIPRYFRALYGEASFPEIACNAPWVSAVIESDGEVRPCFFHPSLGNIRDTALEDILNSDDAVAFRRGLDVNADDICRKCVCTLNLAANA